MWEFQDDTHYPDFDTFIGEQVTVRRRMRIILMYYILHDPFFAHREIQNNWLWD